MPATRKLKSDAPLENGTYEEITLFHKYNDKFFNFIQSVDNHEALLGTGELSKQFLLSLSNVEFNEINSVDQFLTISRSTLHSDNFISMGSIQSDDDANKKVYLNISNFGKVETDWMFIESNSGESLVTVDNYGQLTVDDGIYIGSQYDYGWYEEGIDSATLHVKNNGTINGHVSVYNNGLLKGNGNINGSIFVDGGVVAPGNSPGILNILGNLTVSSGTIEIEVNGLNYGEYDIISRSRFNRDNVLNLAKHDPARPFFFCRGEDPAWVTRFHQ